MILFLLFICFSVFVTFLTFALDIYELVHNVQEIIVNLTPPLKPLKIQYEEIVFILIEMKYKNVQKLCLILLVEHLVNSFECRLSFIQDNLHREQSKQTRQSQSTIINK